MGGGGELISLTTLRGGTELQAELTRQEQRAARARKSLAVATSEVSAVEELDNLQDMLRKTTNLLHSDLRSNMLKALEERIEAELVGREKMDAYPAYFDESDFEDVEGVDLGEANQFVAAVDSGTRAWLQGLSPGAKAWLITQLKTQGTQEVSKIMIGLCFQGDTSRPDPNSAEALEWLKASLAPQGPPMPTVDATRSMTALVSEIGTLRAYLKGVQLRAEKSTGDVSVTLKEISMYMEMLLARMFREAASEYGLSNYALLSVGSMARGEMFPHSDVDYSLVYIGHAKEKVKEIHRFVDWQLRLLGTEGSGIRREGLDGIGVGNPEMVARQHVTDVKDVLLDAKVIAQVHDADNDAWDDYQQAVQNLCSNDEERKQVALKLLAEESRKFHPTDSDYMKNADKDAKKGLLRLPIFVARNVCLYLNIHDATELSDRLDKIVERNFMSPSVRGGFDYVVNYASELRKTLHAHYGKEEERFYLSEDAKESSPHKDSMGETPYILPAPKRGGFDRCISINTQLFQRALNLTVQAEVNWRDLVPDAAEPTLVWSPADKIDRTTTITGDHLEALVGQTQVRARATFVDDFRMALQIEVGGKWHAVQADTLQLQPAIRKTTNSESTFVGNLA
jgi:predicted nucleotidyltransferase